MNIVRKLSLDCLLRRLDDVEMAFRGTPQPVLMILGSCASLQIGAAIAVPLMAKFGAGLTTSLRLLLAASLLLLVCRPRPWTWNRDQWLAIVLFGASLAGMNGFFYAAIARIPLGIAVTIEFAGPLLLSALLSRRLRDFIAVIAAALAIVVLGAESSVSPNVDLDIRGVAYALIAAAFWAFYILAGRHLGTRVTGHGALPISMAIGAAAVIPFGIGAMPALSDHLSALMPFLTVAVLSSVIPYSLELAAMRHLSSQTFGILLSLEPAIASVAGWFFLRQPMTPLQALAIVVVIGASIAATRSRGTAPERQSVEDRRTESMEASPAVVAGCGKAE